jgi:hypothetical protein
MTEMTLHETQVDDQGFTTTIQQSELKVSLPVNPDWLKQRAALRNRIARILLIVGGIVLLISIIAAFIINSISNGSIAVLFVGAGGGGLGGLAVIIGAAIPFLKGVGMDPTVYAGARFLDNAIIIRRVSPEFLEGLPAWDGPTN